MKKHGIWQFHRSLHERGPHIQWWRDGEIDKAFRRFSMVSGQWLGGAFIQSPYRKMDIVIRCANRYMRRYGLRRDVHTWNSVCNVICQRMRAHMNTCKAVLHSPLHYRSKSMLSDVYKDELDHPSPKRSLFEITMRLDRVKDMRKTRREELERRCCVCQKNDAHISRYFWTEERKLLGLEDVLKERPSYKCCTPCHLRLGKLLAKAKEADEARLSIQRFKRKQNESTKNNARTA